MSRGAIAYQGAPGAFSEEAARAFAGDDAELLPCPSFADVFEALEAGGLVFSGKAPDQPIMQILELPTHPFFMGTQAHPCLTSRPLRPQPMFVGLVAAAMQRHHLQGNLPSCVEAVRRVCAYAEV